MNESLGASQEAQQPDPDSLYLIERVTTTPAQAEAAEPAIGLTLTFAEGGRLNALLMPETARAFAEALAAALDAIEEGNATPSPSRTKAASKARR